MVTISLNKKDAFTNFLYIKKGFFSFFFDECSLRIDIVLSHTIPTVKYAGLQVREREVSRKKEAGIKGLNWVGDLQS